MMPLFGRFLLQRRPRVPEYGFPCIGSKEAETGQTGTRRLTTHLDQQIRTKMNRDQFEQYIRIALSHGSSANAEAERAIKLCLHLYDETIDKTDPGWITRNDLAVVAYGTGDDFNRENVKRAINRIRPKLAEFARSHPDETRIFIEDDRGTTVRFTHKTSGRLMRAYRLVIDEQVSAQNKAEQTARFHTSDISECALASPANQVPQLCIPQIQWLPERSPPGALLRADIDKPVPFHGRENELSELLDWCSSDTEIACRLYTGPGGMGKTRLMVELCQRLPKPSCAGFLPDFSGTGREAAWWSTASNSTPMLIVIDYAEHRRVDLEQLLSSILPSPDVHVRIALLARAADDWWTMLKSARGDIGDFLSGPATQHRRLAPLAMTKELRAHSFHLAHAHFSKVLGVNHPSDAPNPDTDFSAAHFDHALLLHMAALATVDGVIVEGENGILDYILNRERRFWAAQTNARGIPAVLHRAVEQAIAILKLGGGASSRLEALDVLSDTPLLRDQDTATVNAIAEMLHALYPGNKWIEPLQPDLLGDHLADQALAEDKHGILQILLRYR